MIAGAFVGLISGLTGVGGGVFLAPMLIALRWASPKQTAALSAPFILANSIMGSVGVSLAGQLPSSHLVLYAAAALGAVPWWVRLSVCDGCRRRQPASSSPAFCSRPVSSCCFFEGPPKGEAADDWRIVCYLFSKTPIAGFLLRSADQAEVRRARRPAARRARRLEAGRAWGLASRAVKVRSRGVRGRFNNLEFSKYVTK